MQSTERPDLLGEVNIFEWSFPPSAPAYQNHYIKSAEVAVYYSRAGCSARNFYKLGYGEIVLLMDAPQATLTCRDSHGEKAEERLGARQVCFISPGLEHGFSWPPEAKVLVIYIQPELFSRWVPAGWSGCKMGEFADLAGRDPSIWQVASLCQRLLGEGEPSEALAIVQLGAILARRLIKENFSPRLPERGPGLSPRQLRAVTEYMERNLRRAPKISDLAAVVGVSPLHLIRTFRNTTGVPPARYQRMCRMGKAAEMLNSGEYRIKEISAAVGFTDLSYFDRCFRKSFGVAPSDYKTAERAKKS